MILRTSVLLKWGLSYFGDPGTPFSYETGDPCHLFSMKIGVSLRDWVGGRVKLMGGGIGFGWVLGRYWSEGIPIFI